MNRNTYAEAEFEAWHGGSCRGSARPGDSGPDAATAPPSRQLSKVQDMGWKEATGRGWQAGLGMLAPQVVKTLYFCLSGHSCQESWGKRGRRAIL